MAYSQDLQERVMRAVELLRHAKLRDTLLKVLSSALQSLPVKSIAHGMRHRGYT